MVSGTARTAEISDETDLAGGIAYLREHCEKIGRQDAPLVICGSIVPPGEKPSPAQLIDKIGELKSMGVCGAAAHINGRTRKEWCDNAQRFAEDVLSKLPKN
jgi:hypothetical protein